MPRHVSPFILLFLSFAQDPFQKDMYVQCACVVLLSSGLVWYLVLKSGKFNLLRENTFMQPLNTNGRPIKNLKKLHATRKAEKRMQFQLNLAQWIILEKY